MLTLIIDTNFLLIPYQFGVDIFAEIDRAVEEPYQLKIIDKTVDELNYLVEHGKGAEKAAAKLGLDLLKRFEVGKIETDKLLNVDKLIVNSVSGPEIAVATQDRALKAEIKKKNGRLVVMRQKNRLELI